MLNEELDRDTPLSIQPETFGLMVIFQLSDSPKYKDRLTRGCSAWAEAKSLPIKTL